ncbi:recombination repair protein 1 isoform X2 [Drosophila nasuta]|uniref:recombination repair protein 1 isoform X2 n=1 Tax=Drosophila nasuta TaxID=42062 RepID=UPI00295E4639|nr:recombination repair protein 1 isoform X2 [Drosophila nasuta]
MPRAKVQKKQVTPVELSATNGIEVASATAAASDAADASGQPLKGRARGKTAAVSAASPPEDTNDVQKAETVVAKKITSRGKRKATNEKEAEVKEPLRDDFSATDDLPSSSVAVKGRARSKKVVAPKANDILDSKELKVQEDVVKKSAGRGKAKLPEEPVEIGDAAPPKPRGRAKKPTTEAVEEEIVAKPTKSRAKKEITLAPVEHTVSKGKGRAKKAETNPQTEEDTVSKDLAPEETVERSASKGKGRAKKTADTKTQAGEVPEVASKDLKPKARGRKKELAENVDNELIAATEHADKDVKEAKKESTETSSASGSETAPATKKRGRGNKRLADTEISEILEEDGVVAPPQSETEVKAVSKETTGKRKNANDDKVEVPAKKRGKKAMNGDADDQPQVKEVAAAPAAKKRAPKRATNDDQNEDPAPAANKPPRGRKRTAAETEDNSDAVAVSEADGSTTSKTKKQAVQKTDAPAAGSYDKTLFPPPTDKEFNLKVSSWNVAGLRAWLKKDGLKFVDFEEPDILCLQETKCVTDQLPDEMARLPGYHPYWLCMPGGYAGVAIYSKIMPINVEYGIGNEEFDDVGRMITAEYEKFYLINVYVPNSGRKLVNLEPRMRWEKLFQAYVQKLDALKPVVICGDMNVSHLEIDLANPKSNTRNAGFTKEEREKMTELLDLGFVDTFRHLYPKQTGAYSFWTYMSNARARNVGWRLDYCIVSERFVPRIVDNVMRSHCLGSDHCPITVFLNI